MMYSQCVQRWSKGETKELLNMFYPKFTYTSNKIENKETRLRDVEAIFKREKVTDFKGNKKTISEIINHRDLCNNILKLSEVNGSKLSLNLIKTFHQGLIKDCFTDGLLEKGEKQGEIKRDDYVIGIGPLDVERTLEFLVDEINDVQINDNNALKVVSYFICEFSSIDPLAEYNGRVGRMLLNYLLIGNNFPPIIFFGNDIEEYYLALEHFNETQKIDKMVKFLDDQSYKTWVKNYNLKVKDLKDFL